MGDALYAWIHRPVWLCGILERYFNFPLESRINPLSSSFFPSTGLATALQDHQRFLARSIWREVMYLGIGLVLFFTTNTSATDLDDSPTNSPVLSANLNKEHVVPSNAISKQSGNN